MALNSAFFDAVRLTLLDGTLEQSQVDGRHPLQSFGSVLGILNTWNAGRAGGML